MKLLHELLVYVSYQYEGDENLDQDECKKYLSPLYAEDDDAKENLPKCYTKEIGWKMFIPPLMKYEGKSFSFRIEKKNKVTFFRFNSL